MIKTGSALSIARQSKLLGVSRSSVYYRPKPESQEELDLLKRLDEIFTAHPIYGSRRLQVMLKREGILVGRRRIRRLMKKLGLWAIGPKPDSSKPHPEHKIYPYGQAMDNALRCPPLAHRSAADHKLHSAQSDRYKIRESQNHLSGSGLSLFHPGGCPSYRDHRTGRHPPTDCPA